MPKAWLVLTVTGLFIYPIKSLAGISLREADVVETGFRYDRRWMLINDGNRQITQRDFPVMALLAPTVNENELVIQHKTEAGNLLHIPLEPVTTAFEQVQVFDDYCTAQLVGRASDEWFSDILHTKCRLVYMPGHTHRYVDRRYAADNEITTFTDAYPFLIIGERSLEDLNSRMIAPLPMNRFRPNIVFTGGESYEEDRFEHFIIGTVEFKGTKRCGRCMITTIDQETTMKGSEPLKTLAGYRSENNKIYFGQYLIHRGKGIIKTGAEITVRPNRIKNDVAC